jgi:hypothetical protein
MPERIYKLQPNRCLALRGFDDLGASAAIHSATETGFKVSGNFRDTADFAVLNLWDADNFYEHPRIKYLPDFRFAGLTLQFDVKYTGLMQLDSPKYPSIDWPFLDIIRQNGAKAQIRLSNHATLASGVRTKAQAAFTVQSTGMKEFDRLTLFYQNTAFDYFVPKVECSFGFTGQGTPGHTHTVTVDGTAYSYVEKAGDTNTSVALGVMAALEPSPRVSATQDPANANWLILRAKQDDGTTFVVSSGGTSFTVHAIGPLSVARELATQITAQTVTASIPLKGTADGPVVRISAEAPGEDGNSLAMYAIWKNERLRTDVDAVSFTGGSSDATWRVTLDFSALGIADARLMWLTFAPRLAIGSAFSALEWEAEFSNWNVTGPDAVRWLKVAGPGSVRVEESDEWCKYNGTWTQTQAGGFFSDGFARYTSTVGDTVTIKYACTYVHDLYIGTSLARDRGVVAVTLDGDAATDLNCALDVDAEVNTRRRVRTSVPAGEHTAVIRLKQGPKFYFDFLEAAVLTDLPEPLAARPLVSPALDYSTDHTYKLSPARILWIFDALGFQAPLNEYIGVFWWNQRKRVGAELRETRFTFNGTWIEGDALFLKIGENETFELGKYVTANDTPATIAKHFAQFINGYSVAVWAAADGNSVTVTSRSPKPIYTLDITVRTVLKSGSSGTVARQVLKQGGVAGDWVIDEEQTPALNRGARDWHSDLFLGCAARNREITVATSMELVNPPSGFAALFPDGQIVETVIGFGSLKSTHCAFVSAVEAYQKKVYKHIADLMAAAGLTPNLQCGEFSWWYFGNRDAEHPNGGMGYYHPELTAGAQTAFGRPLHKFVLPTDDPNVNGGADATYLRNRLRDHIAGIIAHVKASHPNAKFEVLFPYDVNYPEPAGIHNIGGRLNRFVNLPIEWERKETAGFDRLKTEALDFGAWSRNLDLARTAFRLPLELGWPRDSVRHLVPVFRGGYPFEKEIAMAEAEGVPVVNLWAYDHVCIYGWPPSPGRGSRSSHQG